MSFLAMLKLVPRWMWLGLAVLAVLAGLAFWHNRSISKAVAVERGRLTAVYEAEKVKAQEVQRAQAQQASEAYQKQAQTERVRVEYRMMEVIRYAKANSSKEPKTCHANDFVGDDFQRVYNCEDDACKTTN